MKSKFSILLLMLISCVLISCENKTAAEDGSKRDDYEMSGDATANEGYFEWSTLDDTEIVGYTEEGLKQTELVIPEKCTSVQGLKDNTTVKKVTFKNPDTEVLSNTFRGCTSLESVVLPENLEIIEDSLFNGCSSLKSIVIPDKVYKIEDNAFWKCTALEEVSLAKKLSIVGRKAFSDCSALKKVEIPDHVTTIEKAAFENCSLLKDVVFGTGIEIIGESAFQACESLEKIELPESVKSLDIWTFAYCDALEEIYIPESLEKIEVSSIVQTHEIKVYVVEGSYADQQLETLMGVEFYVKKYQ